MILSCKEVALTSISESIYKSQNLILNCKTDSGKEREREGEGQKRIL